MIRGTRANVGRPGLSAQTLPRPGSDRVTTIVTTHQIAWQLSIHPAWGTIDLRQNGPWTGQDGEPGFGCIGQLDQPASMPSQWRQPTASKPPFIARRLSFPLSAVSSWLPSSR